MYYVGSDRDRNYCAVALFFPLLTSYTMELMETLKVAMEQSDQVQAIAREFSTDTEMPITKPNIGEGKT